MSEEDHIGEPDYSLGFINRVIFCVHLVYQTRAQNVFLTPDRMHILYEGVHVGAMFWGQCSVHGRAGVTFEYKRDV